MQVRAYILLWLWGLLLLEPLSANLSIVSMYSICAEKQRSCSGKEESQTSCCSKKSCELPDDNEEENDCEGMDCNPLMSCPGGNFYFHNPSLFAIAPFVVTKQRMILRNDNRISKQLAECWHPPEII